MMTASANADDYWGADEAYKQAWEVLGPVEVPPSLEVFRYGLERLRRDNPSAVITPQHYARVLMEQYERPMKDFRQR